MSKLVWKPHPIKKQPDKLKNKLSGCFLYGILYPLNYYLRFIKYPKKEGGIIKRTDKLKITNIIVMVTIMVLCFIITPYFAPNIALGLDSEDVTYLKEWVYTDADGVSHPITAPTNIDSGADEKLTISTVLPSDAVMGESLCIRSSQQEMRVSFGEDIIYEYGHNSTDFIGEFVGSVWHIVRIPAQYSGQEVSLTFSSSIEPMNGTVNDIYYGSKSAIMFSLLDEYFNGLVLSLIIFVIGVILIVANFFLIFKSKKKEFAVLYIGISAILISFWILGESKMLQFICSDMFFIHTLPYFALLIYPIPMMYYFDTAYEKHFKVPLKTIANIMTINFLAAVVLHYFCIFNFFQSIMLYNILLVVSVLMVLGSLVVETFKYKNNQAKSILQKVCVLFFFFVLEILNFFTNGFSNVSQYMSIGIVIFIIILSLQSISNTLKLFEFENEARYYEKLAMHDSLTGCANRMAYYRDIERYFVPINSGKFWLVICDLNNLKALNDNQGHPVGDKAIINLAKTLESHFGKGFCYRIGGDEFSIIFIENSKDEFCTALQKFQALIAKDRTVTLGLDVAVGYGLYDEMAHANFEEFTYIVDKKMYDNKALIKSL